MADTGLRSPATLANDTSRTGTGFNWTNVSAAAASDNDYATTTAPVASYGSTEYLKATNFGFSIPLSATIDGIEVLVEGGSGLTGYGIVQLVSGGVVQATTRGDNSGPYSFAIYGEATRTFGGATDKWGGTYTPAIVNATDFGCTFVYQATHPFGHYPSIDHIQIRVHYTETGSTYIETSGEIPVVAVSGGTDTQLIYETAGLLLLLAEIGGEGWGNLYDEVAGIVLAQLQILDSVEGFSISELTEGDPALVISDGQSSFSVGRRPRYRALGITTINPYAVTFIKRSSTH